MPTVFDCKGMVKKIRARSFLRRFSHAQGTIWEWNEKKLEGGGSQILVTSHLHGVLYEYGLCSSVLPLSSSTSIWLLFPSSSFVFPYHGMEVLGHKYLRAATFQFFHIPPPNGPVHVGKPSRKRSSTNFVIHCSHNSKVKWW